MNIVNYIRNDEFVINFLQQDWRGMNKLETYLGGRIYGIWRQIESKRQKREKFKGL